MKDRRMKKVFLYLILNTSFVCFVPGQEIYYSPLNTPFVVQKVNLKDCVEEIVLNLQDYAESEERYIYDMTFYPNGDIYLTTRYRLLRYNINRNEVTEIIPIEDLLEGDENNYFVAASEEGRFVISGGSGESGIYDYDLRNMKLIENIDDEGIYSANTISGIIGNKFFIGSAQKEDSQLGLWDPITKEIELISIGELQGSETLVPALNITTCQMQQVINTGGSNSGKYNLVRIDIESGMTETLCSEVIFNTVVFGLATPTDFRQSPLRIDLDDDNSSGHITAG